MASIRPGRSAIEERLRRGQPLPEAAAYGRQTYFADLHAARGDRHVRVCAGAACFIASGGGRHLPQVEAALGVAAGACAPDGSRFYDLVAYSGWEYLRVAAGLDFRLSRVIGFGLYGSVALGEYSRYDDEDPSTTDSVESSAHTTSQVGLRMILFP